MYTIVGSGFGLYGYLPAVVRALGEDVVLPRAYQPKLKRRPELSDTMQAVQWAADSNAALAAADSVVIAVPPHWQAQIVSRCVSYPGIRRLILEKPLAPTPACASAVLQSALAARKRCRIGYTFLETDWNALLKWPSASEDDSRVFITWHFMAHHFSQDVSTWKRRHVEGGGVLRFFGIHLLALLADRGYSAVRMSSLNGENIAEPERWHAVFSGTLLPDCYVFIDSRCSNCVFEIVYSSSGFHRRLVSMSDPFERKVAYGTGDRRIATLEKLLRTFELDDGRFNALYHCANELWRLAEVA